MFESIKSIRPYFFSLREIDGNVSLDIKLPITWKFETILSPYKTIKSKTQDKNEKVTLISLITTATQEGYDLVFECALDIIRYNEEEEEKQRLYQLKIKELQELFQKEPLNKLKELNLIDYGQTHIGMVGETDGEGQDGDREPQETND